MDKKRIVGYARIGRADEYNRKPQTQMIKELVGKRDDCELTGMYEDIGMSGRSKFRPAYEDMLKDAEEHKFDYIIVKSIAKFGRDVTELIRATKRLRELGIGIYFYTENICTTQPETDNLFALLNTIEDAYSEFKNTLKSIRLDT